MGEGRLAAVSGDAFLDGPGAPDPSSLEAAVRCEQIRILYQSPALIAINALNAVLVAYILKPVYPSWIVAAWVACMAITVSARIYNSRRYASEPQPDETAGAWGLRFAVGAFATGCLWGLAGSAIFLTPDPAYHSFTAFVLGGMMAGAVLSDSAYLPALFGFVAPAVIPAILAFLFRSDPMSITMGLLLAAFTAALGSVGLRANRWIESSARRGLIQAALTADLKSEVAVRKAAESELARLTQTDFLTGLPNRRSFMQRLSEEFETAKRGVNPLTVLYIDLDRFKDINETLGHSKGDDLLNAVAARLAGGLRDADFIARVGGDEFAVLLGSREDPAAAETAAKRITALMADPYDVGGAEIYTTASIGISVYRASMTKPEDMMRQADLAVYEAKDAGRNQYRFHSEALDSAVIERVSMIKGLRTALERGQFELYYQPQVEAPSGAIIGLEALLRWNHPERGVVSPGLFIATAEKTGMIAPIGRWVLTEVCRQLRVWRDEGVNPPLMGVNLSAAQLITPLEFERSLAQALKADRIDPATIELELTETVIMETTRGHAGAIERLREAGVRIAIDDFGTGYSSLEYLRAYQVNRIKIAQQFVSGLPGDPGSAAIVRATIGLAREFGIEVIAEGVETQGQLEFLIGSGCRAIQGYYFGRPVPALEAAMLLRQGVLAPAAGDGQASSMQASSMQVSSGMETDGYAK